MIITTANLTFNDFLEQYPEDNGRFELVDGEMIELPATRRHGDIADCLDRRFYQDVTRL